MRGAAPIQQTFSLAEITCRAPILDPRIFWPFKQTNKQTNPIAYLALMFTLQQQDYK